MRRLLAIAAALAAFSAGPAGALDLPFHGFLETAFGSRVVEDHTADDEILLEEARFQLDFLHDGKWASIEFRSDFLYDGVDEESQIDVREAYILLPFETVDLKVGRQILTWGTGDFVFLNDLFPKDWQSFLIGRDDEYLKEPANALRATWFGDWVNLDVVWMPVFEPDEYISGERLSFYDPSLGRIRGPKDGDIDTKEPDKDLGNGQFAARLYRNFAGWETALYGFQGHDGQPSSFDVDEGKATFPQLQAWGASVRGALLGGIANGEVSWYRSLDDLDGDDPTVPNSQFRALVGYTHEIVANQTLGLQGYLERVLEYPSPGFTDQNRWWITVRYTGLFWQQNLILSWFSFYSPSEDDAYLRPKVQYKLTDAVLLTLGGNVFLGAHEDTFFGQFEHDTNVYARVRYSF